jgi:hypothetical protein
MNDNPVERAARAIDPLAWDEKHAHFRSALSRDRRAASLKAARAAIASLREPSSTWQRGYEDGFNCREPEADDHLVYWDGWRRGALDGLVRRSAMAKQEGRRITDADLFLTPP